jgi:hypothetical protein
MDDGDQRRNDRHVAVDDGMEAATDAMSNRFHILSRPTSIAGFSSLASAAAAMAAAVAAAAMPASTSKTRDVAGHRPAGRRNRPPNRAAEPCLVLLRVRRDTQAPAELLQLDLRPPAFQPRLADDRKRRHAGDHLQEDVGPTARSHVIEPGKSHG